ncbi:MAG TPA: 4Fe-4S dicluster domain-containing protein [Oceanithermus profundus]|uniref:4Fe-4S dicluster domain-containing protein n=1 Tax=Oceanithermus profundus TaxID=187137 RepID=A0A7C4Z5A9_9DEIN|nr:4Fe-4S dicluster domain-containing protein [Oceanithermus profundus]
MGLFDNLLGAFLKLTDPTPRYTGSRCLVERYAVGGCDLCVQACPHEAVDLSHFTVQIDDTRCTGCGLCTQVCPGVALEFPLGPMQEALDKGRGQLKCSKAEGHGQEVLCLGRLTPGLLAEAASRHGPLTLARGDCENCKIGGPTVPEALERVIEEARRYYPELEVRLTNEPLPGAIVGRRELFEQLLGGTKRMAAEVLPEPPEQLGLDEDHDLPAELRLRKLAAARSQGEVRWPAIQVLEGCTLCPVCANVCPTGAVKRVREGEEYVLELEVAACTGCGGCVASCPPQVIELVEAGRDRVLAEEPQELFRGEPEWS